jgi:hypothetical protein
MVRDQGVGPAAPHTPEPAIFSPSLSVCGTIAAVGMAPEIVTNAIVASLSHVASTTL